MDVFEIGIHDDTNLEYYDYEKPADWWKSVDEEDSEGEIAIIELEYVELREPKTSQTLESWFNERAKRWAIETGMHSSPVIRFMHEDYQAIIARGPQIIPLVLNRLKQQPDDWFWALRYLADTDAASDVIGFDAAVKAWLKWGSENGYI